LRWVDRLLHQGAVTGLDDGQTLQRLLADRDELALETLVARHGPLVLGVCRRLLKSPHDIDDAFQATFLILIRKAPALHDYHRLAPWLHRVAYRVAMRAKADATRRRELEQRKVRNEATESMPAADTLAVRAELCELVDREIARGREKGTSLISTVCEANEPRGHARKRLMQAA
jgi:RNA polymerase sigma factor (sigma-70 family)